MAENRQIVNRFVLNMYVISTYQDGKLTLFAHSRLIEFDVQIRCEPFLSI